MSILTFNLKCKIKWLKWIKNDKKWIKNDSPSKNLFAPFCGTIE